MNAVDSIKILITRGRIGDLTGVNGFSAKSLLSFLGLYALIIILYSSQVTMQLTEIWICSNT